MILIYAAARADNVHRLVAPILHDIPWSFVPADRVIMPDPDAGDVVLAMGQACADELSSLGLVPKKRTISSLREKPIRRRANGGHLLLTYAPGIGAVDSEKGGNVIWDLRLARRLHQTGSITPVYGAYRWMDVDGLEALVAEYVARAEVAPLAVAGDLETMGFFPWYKDKHIVTAQFTADEHKGHVIHTLSLSDADLKRAIAAIRTLHTHPRVRMRGANYKFDLGWMREKWGIECTNFTMDTLLVGSLLDENRSNSLKWHACEHTDLGGYELEFEKRHDKSHMEKVPVEDEEYLNYTGGDVDSCLQVSNVQLRSLREQPDLARFYQKLVHPAARAFEKIEARGVLVDLDVYGEVERELKEEIAHAHADCIRQMPARLRAKHAGQLSLTRSALVADFMFGPLGLGLKPLKTTPSGKVATDKAHLQMFLDVEEAQVFLEAHARWNVANKMLTTYVHGFLEHLRPDGRFHATYLLYNGSAFGDKDDDSGTATGRLAAKNPAIQTVPKHPKKGHKFWAKMLRKAFPAPPGYVFFEVDFSQGELKITACVAQEDNMLAAYKNNMDLHCLTGAGAGNMPYEDFYSAYQRMDAEDPTLDPKLAALVKRLRQQAKASNFGLLYGMGASGYRIYARDVYGVSITEAEAVKIWNAFFATYPGLTEWHSQYKKFAKRRGYIVSPLGRVRHLPLIKSREREQAALAERQAVNSPIQSTLSDMCLLAITEIERRYGATGEVLIGMMTHDSIGGYMLADRAQELGREITGIMASLPLHEFDWRPELTFTADIQVGPTWGELKKAA